MSNVDAGGPRQLVQQLWRLVHKTPHPPCRSLCLCLLLCTSFPSPLSPRLKRSQRELNLVMSECPSCERYFDTSHALHQHNVSKHSTTYCPPCRRFFWSRSAKQQHIKDSPQHTDNICNLCPHNPDFDTQSELDEHLAEKHVYCSTCDLGFDSQSQLAQHDVLVHHMCKDCPGRYFNSASNLKNVSAPLFLCVVEWRLISSASQDTRS